MKEEPLDKFGKFIVENLLDKGICNGINLIDNKYKSAQGNIVGDSLQNFTADQKEILKAMLIKTLVSTTHDFLFALEERNDLDEDIVLLVDHENIVEESDGLQGELFSESGWIAKYSKYEKLIN